MCVGIDDNSPVSSPTNEEEADELITADDLEADFAITTNKIKQALISSSEPVDVASVIQQLQTSTAVKNKNVPLFDEGVFKNVTTIEMLWEKLSRFWSIFDYDLLLFVLKIVKCEEADKIFKKFLSKIDISRMEDTDLVLCYKVIEQEGSMKPSLRIKVIELKNVHASLKEKLRRSCL